jgi:RNA polymerase sigma-70 factor, ECF subfamily
MATVTWNVFTPAGEASGRETIDAVSCVRESRESEAELIVRARQGDNNAFYALVKPCERMIYFTALGMLRNEADAEEVAQEAILKAFKGLATFRQGSKFSTWLTQIALNEAKMRLRKDRRHLYESIDAAREDSQPVRALEEWREVPLEWLERSTLRDALRAALMSLEPKYRTVMLLRDVEHMNIADTAHALGISCACVKTRLARARMQMRALLADWRMGNAS